MCVICNEILQTKLNHNQITNVNLLTIIIRLLYLMQTCTAQIPPKKLRCKNTMKWKQTKLFLSSMHSLALTYEISKLLYHLSFHVTFKLKCPKC